MNASSGSEYRPRSRPTLRQARGGRGARPGLGGGRGRTRRVPRGSRSTFGKIAGTSRFATSGLLRETVQTRLNLELATEPSIVPSPCDFSPHPGHFRPRASGRADDRRRSGRGGPAEPASCRGGAALSEGGRSRSACSSTPGSTRSRPRPIWASRAVELHTGRYADATDAGVARELAALIEAGAVKRLGMALHAGHGLNYRNVADVARIDGMAELNIGHSIISRAIFSGIGRGLRTMKAAMNVKK